MKQSLRLGNLRCLFLVVAALGQVSSATLIQPSQGWNGAFSSGTSNRFVAISEYSPIGPTVRLLYERDGAWEYDQIDGSLLFTVNGSDAVRIGGAGGDQYVMIDQTWAAGSYRLIVPDGLTWLDELIWNAPGRVIMTQGEGGGIELPERDTWFLEEPNGPTPEPDSFSRTLEDVTDEVALALNSTVALFCGGALLVVGVWFGRVMIRSIKSGVDSGLGGK